MFSSPAYLTTCMNTATTAVSKKPRKTVFPSESSGFFIGSSRVYVYQPASEIITCHEIAANSAPSASLDASMKALSPVASLLRRHDRDRYLTALFAPGERREGLMALYAFNYEV